jgi:hypothetical protein
VAHISEKLLNKIIYLPGTAGWTRTTGLLIHSQAL